MASSPLPRKDLHPICRHQAEVVRSRRVRAGLSQAQLADKAGLDRGTVQALESMKKVPKTDTMAFIAEALGISQTELMAECERCCHQEKLNAYSNPLTSPA